MPLVEEDAISRDVRKTRESSSGKFQALSDFIFLLYQSMRCIHVIPDPETEEDSENDERHLRPRLKGRVRDGMYKGKQKLNNLNIM